MPTAPPKVNESRLITNIALKKHNARVVAYIKNELKDDRAKAKAFATAYAIKRTDAPSYVADKILQFTILFERPWEQDQAPSQWPSIRTNNLPCIVINFRQKIKDQWHRDTYYKTLYFPSVSIIEKIKHGNVPTLPSFHLGRHKIIHQLKNGTTFTVNGKSKAESEKWVRLLQNLIDDKWHNPKIQPPILMPDTIDEKILHPRSIKYYPNGLAEKGFFMVGYF